MTMLTNFNLEGSDQRAVLEARADLQRAEPKRRKTGSALIAT